MTTCAAAKMRGVLRQHAPPVALQSTPLVQAVPCQHDPGRRISAGLSEAVTPSTCPAGVAPCTILFLQCTPSASPPQLAPTHTLTSCLCIQKEWRLLAVSVGTIVGVKSQPLQAAYLTQFARALQAWRLLAVFLGTIVGIITQPLPLGAVAMLGLGAAMLTKTLTFAAAFSAFASEIP